MQKYKHSIAIDEAKFKKTSKKLLSKLNEEHSLNLKLNSIQELLAESLGFRNLFALQKAFEEGQGASPSFRFDLFKGLTSEESTQIILNLMDIQDSSGMWESRAEHLISTVMMILTYMREKKDILLDAEVIREYLILEHLIKLNKEYKEYFPGNIRWALKSYLISIPGFQIDAPKQSDTTREQHGFLQMQFSSILNKLSAIELDNFVIANKNWFEPNTLVLKKQLKDLDCIDISWINVESYKSWIHKAFKTKEVIKISDLLVYTSTIISPQKKAEMCFLLNSIFNNLYNASAISKEIESAI